MADIEFQDNSIKVKSVMKEAAIAFLHETAGEIASQAAKNSRVKPGQTSGSYAYKVDKAKLEAKIGSPLENALWEEFGTGEYAVHGDGRKGYWVFVEGSSTGHKGGKSYDLAGAKRAVAILRGKGLNAYYTKGKRPKHALEKAGNTVAPKAKAAAEKQFGKLG